MQLLGRIAVLYVDVAYYYRVAWSVGVYRDPCKTAEPIKMPLGC